MINTKDFESDLFGEIRIGKVESVDPVSYRSTVRLFDSLGNPSNVITSPSEYFGHLPEAGTIAILYDVPGWEKHVIGYLGTVNDKTSEEVEASGESNVVHVPFSSMKPGDTYIGKYGRAYFNSSGDVTMKTFHERASVELNDKEATVNISGYNFDIYTPGGGISIFSESSVPGIFGDNLYIQRTAPSSAHGLPADINPIPNILISEIALDTSGDVSLGAGWLEASSTFSSSITLDITGDLSMGNVQGCALNLFADTEVDLHNPLASLRMNADGSSLFSTSMAEVAIDTNGFARMSALPAPASLATASISFNGTAGTSDLFANSTNTITAVVANNITAPTNNITGILNLSGALNLTGAGTVVSTAPMSLTAPGFSILSPNTSFTGNTSISGNTTIAGLMSVIGIPAFSGVLTSAPFLALTEIAFIPVTILVAGVPVTVGRIPVHA